MSGQRLKRYYYKRQPFTPITNHGYYTMTMYDPDSLDQVLEETSRTPDDTRAVTSFGLADCRNHFQTSLLHHLQWLPAPPYTSAPTSGHYHY